MQIATGAEPGVCQAWAAVFKVNKTVTHVCVARPHYLDLEATPVSEGVKRIVEFINAHPKCSRRKLIEALAPSPPPAPIQITPVTTEAAAQPPEGGTSSDAAPAPKPAAPEPTQEQRLSLRTCTGSSIKGTSSNLQTACWIVRRSPFPSRRSPKNKSPLCHRKQYRPSSRFRLRGQWVIPHLRSRRNLWKATDPSDAPVEAASVPVSESIPAASNLPAENSPQSPPA
jgi:hypothetical protein